MKEIYEDIQRYYEDPAVHVPEDAIQKRIQIEADKVKTHYTKKLHLKDKQIEEMEKEIHELVAENDMLKELLKKVL